ncbi:MAG: 4'-phosphopantetheinyl transferase superfamily protein [Longimicrobiales bacterium]|nr:4'-phosphopantetheinyl transferase superfamily protein [Longimicrobiales bacterium]
MDGEPGVVIRDAPSLPEYLPDPGTLHLWIVDLTMPWCDALADSGLASEVERRRAERMATEELKHRLLARRAVLRLILARYLGQDPESVEVVAAPGGKPVLLPRGASLGEAAGKTAGERTASTFPFSVGHSGDLYGVAVGTSASVGFDIERRRGVPRAEAIARRWFGPEEARILDGLQGEELEREFMRLWTGKEALAKRHGAGLRLMMRGDVEELDTARAEREGRLRWLTPRSGYHVSVASDAPIRTVALVIPEDDGWTR